MKTEEKKPISLLKTYTVRYIISGILFIINGFLYFVPNGTDAFDTFLVFVQIMCMLVGIISMMSTYFGKREQTDEMAEYHFLKAKEATLDALLTLGLAGYILMDTINVELPPVRYIWPMFFGIILVLQGIFFIRYEKAGE